MSKITRCRDESTKRAPHWREKWMSRRSFLRSATCSVPTAAIASCSVFESTEGELPPAGTIGRAALLAPLSGARTAIGQVMEKAASIGGGGSGNNAEIFVVDSGETSESAVAAAASAVANGAALIAGPLFSSQARAVANAVGPSVPVVSLTNDSSVAGGNLFVFGVTPLQSAKSILGFAAGRGIRNVGIVVPPGQFGELSISASRQVVSSFGLNLSVPVVSTNAGSMIADLKASNGGILPDAVYLPVVGGPFEAHADALSQAGIQILGSDQWSAINAPRISALQSAWFAAPDPVRFEAFSIALEEQTGAESGVVAGLTFDAVEMARLLGRLGQQNRSGLLREAGFEGIVGPYRFLDTGQCERGLAILKVVDGTTILIGNTAV